MTGFGGGGRRGNPGRGGRRSGDSGAGFRAARADFAGRTGWRPRSAAAPVRTRAVPLSRRAAAAAGTGLRISRVCARYGIDDHVRRPWPPPRRAAVANRRRVDGRRRRGSPPPGTGALFQSVDPAARRLTGRALERRVVLAMIKRRAAAAGLVALDVLPHDPGDGDHGVPVERGDARARPADRGARVAEDDEALRPDGRHGDGRRDRSATGSNGR